MKVVVTGGAGFIGTNLCRCLLTDPAVAEVVVLDDLSTGYRENLAGVDVLVSEGSILDRDFVESVLEGADAVVHLAARPSVARSMADPVTSHTVNTTGTLNVLEAARAVDCRHVVVASSSSVYGNTAVLPKHEDLPIQPRSPYAATKLATETYALAWAKSFGLDVLAFRFFNVFGPFQRAGHAYGAVVPSFVSSALAGKAVPIFGNGEQTRDFTFVDSVTAVISDALHRRVTCAGPVNLAFGGRHSLLDLVAELEGILGRSLPVEFLPERPGDVRDSQADQSRLRSLFPDLHPVTLADGLARTIAWFEGFQ